MKTTAFIKILRLLALSVLGGACMALSARAAGTFMVTTNLDSGPGSLRQAIADANAAGAGTIGFSNVTGTITLTSGQLVFSGNLTLVGPGSANLTVSGNVFSSRVFKIISGSTSSISGLTIADGSGVGGGQGGGGVYNSGHLVLSNCVIARNFCLTSQSSGYGGGGLRNEGTLTLESCTVAFNGAFVPQSQSGVSWGGGIYNLGALIMNNSSVAQNYTLPGYWSPSSRPPSHGGGIYNLGTLWMTRSGITDNYCGSVGAPERGYGNSGQDGGSGGGLYNGSSATLIDCTISGNQCANGGSGDYVLFYGPSYPGGNGGSGGGIYSAGTLNLTNCTIYGNGSGSGGQGGEYVSPTPTRSGDGGNAGDGAGVYSAGTFAMASCSVGKNIAGMPGFPGNAPTFTNLGSLGRAGRAAVWNQCGTAQVLNSLIASNTSANIFSPPDVGGVFASLGHNLIGNTNGSQGFPGSNDLLNLDPKLGSLANNGGSTLTCALLAGSPALDAGDDSLAGTDQRGLPRPSGAHVDIGAFEVQMPVGPIHLADLARVGGSGLRFSFTNTPGASFTVLAATNVAQPSTNWTVLGSPVENAPGSFQYTESQTTNPAQRFYQIRWP